MANTSYEFSNAWWMLFAASVLLTPCYVVAMPLAMFIRALHFIASAVRVPKQRCYVLCLQREVCEGWRLLVIPSFSPFSFNGRVAAFDLCLCFVGPLSDCTIYVTNTSHITKIHTRRSNKKTKDWKITMLSARMYGFVIMFTKINDDIATITF